MEGKFEQFPAGIGQEKIVGVEIAMGQADVVKRFHGVERLVDEGAPVLRLKRAGRNQLAEGLALEQFENLVGAVLGIGSGRQELDPVGMVVRS